MLWITISAGQQRIEEVYSVDDYLLLDPEAPLTWSFHDCRVSRSKTEIQDTSRCNCVLAGLARLTNYNSTYDRLSVARSF